MTTNGQILAVQADKLGIPPRTLQDVKVDLAQAKKTNARRVWRAS